MSDETKIELRHSDAMLDEAVMALQRATPLGAVVTYSHVELCRMQPEHVPEIVSHRLAGLLAPVLEELTLKSESIVRSDRPVLDPMDSATEFLAHTTVINKDDYEYLCRLLRLLVQERQERLSTKVVMHS